MCSANVMPKKLTACRQGELIIQGSLENTVWSGRISENRGRVPLPVSEGISTEK